MIAHNVLPLIVAYVFFLFLIAVIIPRSYTAAFIIALLAFIAILIIFT